MASTLNDVFSLRGEQRMFRGSGFVNEPPERTPEFDLRPGALVVYAEHSGKGRFAVSLNGGFLSRGDELISRDGAGESIAVRRISAAPQPDKSGRRPSGIGRWAGRLAPLPTSTIAAARGFVASAWLGELEAGKYRLSVESTGMWTCGIIQPSLGQSALEIPYRRIGAAGSVATGPFRVGSRPLLASVRHDGGGQFVVRLVSLDGDHECVVANENGQLQFEESPTDAMPGKEYMLFVSAGGGWELEFDEGY